MQSSTAVTEWDGFFRHTDQLEHTGSSENTDNPAGLDQNIITVEGPKHHLEGYTHKESSLCQQERERPQIKVPAEAVALQPSVSMFWSGISKLISIMLDSFQDPLNMLEKYPDYKHIIKNKYSIIVLVAFVTGSPSLWYSLHLHST